MSNAAKLNLAPQSLESAEGQAKAVLDKALEQVGFIPNMYANMVNSPGLLDTYLEGYKLFRESGVFTSVQQEVVFLAISHENGCDYCMSAHSMLADKMSGVPANILEAIRKDEVIPDAELTALHKFSKTVVKKRGYLSQAEVDEFINAGFTERHVLEVVLATAVKTLSNYSNHLFQTPVDEMFADYQWPEAES